MKKQRCMSESRPIKKGPWSAEEDEVLINFVKKNGPRDWSSIQSNGLLPRTGKSCRLRWVNKLRPDLKVGCKLSAEEERIVVELQAKYGNKWAMIASHLQGRTDNDVKNFWSSRKKRLARTLESASELPSNSNKHLCRKQKSALPSPLLTNIEAPGSSNAVIEAAAEPSSSSKPVASASQQPSNIEAVSSLPEPSYRTSAAESSVLLPDLSWLSQQRNLAPISDSSFSTFPLLSEQYQIKDFEQVLADEPTGFWQCSFPCTSSDDFELPLLGGPTPLGSLSNNPDGCFFDDLPTDVFDSLDDI